MTMLRSAHQPQPSVRPTWVRSQTTVMALPWLHVPLRVWARHLALDTAIVLIVFVALNIVLWLMQTQRLPLFTTVGMHNLSLRTTSTASALLAQQSEGMHLHLTIGDKRYIQAAEKVGIGINSQATLDSAQGGEGWGRIPIVQAWRNRQQTTPVVYSLDRAQLERYVQSLSLPARQEAVDARIVLPTEAGGVPATIQPAQEGMHFTVAGIVDQLLVRIPAEGSLDIAVTPEAIPARITAAQLTSALEATNRLLDRKLTLTGGTTRYTLTAAEVQQVVVMGRDADGMPTPHVDRAKMRNLLQALAPRFYTIPPSSSAKGQAMVVQASTEAVATALERGQSSQALHMVAVVPVYYNHKHYMATSEGLAEFLQDFAATNSGSFRIATIELSGDRLAAYNATSTVAPASMYKVFLAYAALKKVQDGTLSLQTTTTRGTVEHCINRMIVVSDNPCAEALLDRLGRHEVDALLRAAGFSQTTLNDHASYMRTTAHDLAALFAGLYRGSLLEERHSSYLLSLMKQQIYRGGIPAGSQGSVVADKVGFIATWNHDGGIVYAPHATYVLVILTTGSNFTAIKELSSQVYRFYNP